MIAALLPQYREHSLSRSEAKLRTVGPDHSPYSVHSENEQGSASGHDSTLRDFAFAAFVIGSYIFLDATIPCVEY